MRWPYSLQASSHERLLLVGVDGSAAMLRLEHGELPECFDVDSANVLNSNDTRGNTAEHLLKVTLVTSDWTLLAESLPVRLLERTAHSPTCINRAFAPPEAGCARLHFPRQPSAELIESIRSNPLRPPCGLNDRIGGVWSNGSYFPFFCKLREFTVQAAQRCVRNRVVILAGTSVVRGLFFGVLRKLGLQPTFVEGKLAVTRQLSSGGTMVESNWWRRVRHNRIAHSARRSHAHHLPPPHAIACVPCARARVRACVRARGALACVCV
jgi:hypothetical protein